MERIGRKVAKIEDMFVFYCPGCRCNHGVNHRWTFNGDGDAPTFSPSLLVRNGHYAGSKDTCWCNYNAERPNEPAAFECSVCHSFVRDGKIEFLTDSTHELSGQTVELPDFEYE